MISKPWISHSLLVQGLRGLTLWGQDTRAWSGTSALTRWTGQLSNWGRNSWLAQALEPLILIWGVLLFAIAPYSSTEVIGSVLLIGVALWLLSLLLKPLVLTPVSLVVLAFWGVTTVSTLCSPALNTSLYGWSLVTLYLIGFALLAQVRRLDWIIGAYLITVGIVGIEGINQWRSGAVALATWVDQESVLKDTTRIYSYLGNPNLLAAYLLPAVPLGVAAALQWSRWSLRLLGLSMSLLALGCIVLTYSRGAWLALAIEIILMALFALQKLPVWGRIALVGGITGVGTLTFIFSTTVQARLLSIFVGRQDSSNNFRITVWETVNQMITDHFWLGIGPGNRTFEAIYPFYQRAGYNALGAYSVPLETLVELGFIGLSISAWALGVIGAAALWAWRRQPSWWVMAALVFSVGLLLQGMVDTVWYRPQIQTLWWLGVALIHRGLVDCATAQKIDPALELR